MATTSPQCSIITFGCQMNKSDSERLATTLENLGYQVKDSHEELKNEQADLVIFNTCSVRQHAEDRVFGMLKQLGRLKSQRPELLIAITGCMTRVSSTQKSQNRDQLLKQLKEVDFVFRIEDLGKISHLIKEVQPNFSTKEMEEAELNNYFAINPRYTNKFQAFVPIMTGCDKFCTYCIVPFTRGREVSRDLNEIYLEVVSLVEQGCIEVTLLGQNVNSYGLSWSDKRSGNFNYDTPPFVQLLKKLDQIPGLKRLRFTSPHPQDMTDDVITTIAEARTMMPYIHLPVQAGNNEVLRRMNRNYTREDYLKIIAEIKRQIPDCALSTDIIVGFPGETDEQFEDTYSLFEEVEFDMSFTARFSPRRGTAAEKLMTDDVSPEEKARRWHKLNDLLKVVSQKKHAQFMGQTLEVLVETYDEKTGLCTGRTPHFKKTEFPGNAELVGKLIDVKIKETLTFLLKGEVAN